jgi:K+-dependent Na+/Ca+ exchanger-like protein
MGIIFYSLIILLAFYMLARVTDVYFIPALETIAKKLKMSSDVAGTTLMAMGSSAPELFIALIAVFRPGGHEEIGMGTIVGSALFNILVIIGAAAMARKATLSWQPVIRDSFFYLLSIALLSYVFYNNHINIAESIILILLYGLYILAVIHWKKWFPYEDDATEVEKHAKPTTAAKNTFVQKFLYPFDFLLKITFSKRKTCMWPAFVISIIWISLLSWLLVESAIHISHTLQIPEAIIALTILAAGTSVPDLISSYLVAKDGKGGMAISNAIGSNIFDILIGLGLPWLFAILIFNEKVEVSKENLISSLVLLFGSVIVVLFIMALRRWKIRRQTGILLILIYVAYLTWQIIEATG